MVTGLGGGRSWNSRGHGVGRETGTGRARYAATRYLHCILLVGDEVDTGLDSGMGPFPEHLLLQLVNIWQGRGRLSLQQGGWSPQTPWDIAAVPSPGPVASPGNSRRDPLLPKHAAHLRTCRRSCRWLCSASSSCSFSWHQGCQWVDLKACLHQGKATRVSPAGTALSPGPPQSLQGEARGQRPGTQPRTAHRDGTGTRS